MVVSAEKKTEVVDKLMMAARLCAKHGFVDWSRRMNKELIPKIKAYEGPACIELLDAGELPRSGDDNVEMFETVLCNGVSTYIDVMELRSLPEQLPPFKYLNGIVLENAATLGALVTQVMVAHGAESESGTQCIDAGLPLEYLHTLIRAYYNKGLLLGFLQKLRSEEFKYLSDKCDQLFGQYNTYSEDEIHRVCMHYGRTCHGKFYDGKKYLAKKAKEQADARIKERKDG